MIRTASNDDRRVNQVYCVDGDTKHACSRCGIEHNVKRSLVKPPLWDVCRECKPYARRDGWA